MLQTPVTNLAVMVQPNTNTDALPAALALFDSLNQAGVRYCHWKSNMRLEQSLAGKTDLDLLVDRRHGPQFRQILNAHQVKPLQAAPGKQYPAIENYLGFDAASGKMFHLHVHYQLVLGEQFVKNYRLPLETQFLDSVYLRHGVPLPAPELELIVLSMRALLKYRDRDAFKDMLSIRSGGLPGAILQEMKWLLGQTSPAQVRQMLRRVDPTVPAAIITEFLELVSRAPRSGWQLFNLRRRLRRALRPYQRANRLQASLAYFTSLWRQRRSTRKMTPVSGGQTVALIGADGSGKSTMSHLLLKWLSWKLDARLYYMGSKQPSRRSQLLYLLFRMARRSYAALAGRLGQQFFAARMLAALRQAMLYSYHLSIGWDRYRRYVISRRQALAGSLVLYDRYPLEAPLDGPKIELLAADSPGAMARAFARWEQRLYRRFSPPDVMLAFDVSPAVSLRRKPDHDRAAIEAKSQLVRRLASTNGRAGGRLNIQRLNADQPFDEVLSQLKVMIWEAL